MGSVAHGDVRGEKRKLSLLGRMVVLLLFLASSPLVWGQTKPPVTWNPAYSGNYTPSSLGRGIDYVVIHTVEGSASGAISWFKNPVSEVSAHYIVDFNGALTQMVADKDIGWHAGNWAYNVHSIGIEHAGYAYKNTWTNAQYKSSAALTRWVCLTYGIPMNRDHILGHVEVPGATHTDPGPYFDWGYYMSLVKKGVSAVPPPAAPPAPPTTATATKAMKVNVSALNVRTGPGLGYSIKGVIYSRQIYVSIESSSGWRKIYYNGTMGWSYGPYLTALSGVTAVKVTVGTLHVRKGPSTAYAIVGHIYQGQLYVPAGSSSGWYKIYFKGGSYWSYGGYLTKVGL